MTSSVNDVFSLVRKCVNDKFPDLDKMDIKRSKRNTSFDNIFLFKYVIYTFVFHLDTRSQLPLQQPFNQIPQTLFTPQQSQDPGIPLGTSLGQLNQLSNSIGVTPFQSPFPDQTSQNLPGYPQNDIRSIGPGHFSPITVNVPMTPPKTIPSFLTASQVYKDFEDVNSRSHLADDIFGGESKYL